LLAYIFSYTALLAITLQNHHFHLLSVKECIAGEKSESLLCNIGKEMKGITDILSSTFDLDAYLASLCIEFPNAVRAHQVLHKNVSAAHSGQIF